MCACKAGEVELLFDIQNTFTIIHSFTLKRMVIIQECVTGVNVLNVLTIPALVFSNSCSAFHQLSSCFDVNLH